MFRKIIEEKKKELSNRKWSCWLAASFAKGASWYEDIQKHPEEWRESAAEDAAKLAMGYLLELHEINADGAKMVADSWSMEIGEMLKTLNYEQKYYKVFI